jgi:pimeloyl-ACP methyl ester carboxylesterase
MSQPTVDGSVARLAADERGSGPAVVLVHGLTFSRRTWEPVADLLARRHRVVAVDLPGHGESEGSAADPRALVERLHSTLRALEVRDPVVVGHSAGAFTATGYAAEHDVTGVVNVDQPMLTAGFSNLVRQLAPALRGPGFEAAFAPFERSIGVDRLPEPERSRVASTRSTRQETVLDHWDPSLRTAPDALQAQVDEMLDAVRAPYLYLSAHEVPDEVRRHLHAHLDRVEVVEWPGTGHLLHLGDPVRFVDLVEQFVTGSR